jgi:hypothetical protein
MASGTVPPAGQSEVRHVRSRPAARRPLAVPAAALVIAVLSLALWFGIFRLAAPFF